MSAVPKKTSSRCTTVAETVSHTFEIVGYSLQKGTGVGKFVRSGTFTVGGYDWAIRFYPDGPSAESKDYVTICLELMTRNATARARYDLKLVSQRSDLCWGCSSGPRLFSSYDVTRFGPRNWNFILRSELEEEESSFLVDDSIRIECEVTVIREPQLSETRVESEIEVPPCDMMEHFGTLLEQKKGADVSFVVGDDSFEAHKIVLAARSPVFMAEFYGRMRESGMCSVTVEDMQPDVFRVLLHFIYTDSLPEDMDDLDRDEYSEMIRLLLVASDRYAMERLKLMCQSILSKNLDIETVATTLALADQQNCDELKAACVEFISASKDVRALAATQGYSSLKRSCPSVLVDLYEKTSKHFKT